MEDRKFTTFHSLSADSVYGVKVMGTIGKDEDVEKDTTDFWLTWEMGYENLPDWDVTDGRDLSDSEEKMIMAQAKEELKSLV